MSDYRTTVRWERGDQNFLDNKYSRGHTWIFDGGAQIAASSSPHVVPVPMSIAENVDPEEAFIASISSCHLLFFLYFAAKRGFVLDTYVDEAAGTVGKNAEGKLAVTKVTLQPVTAFSGDNQPTAEELEELHHQSHENCFIANSVTTEIETILSLEKPSAGAIRR